MKLPILMGSLGGKWSFFNRKAAMFSKVPKLIIEDIDSTVSGAFIHLCLRKSPPPSLSEVPIEPCQTTMTNMTFRAQVVTLRCEYRVK